MVDTTFYAPDDNIKLGEDGSEHPYIIFSAGRLEWVKGWEFALQAVALLLNRGWDVEYYIAGDGELKDLVAYIIDQLGIGDRVHLLGWQSPEEVRNWMQKSDLYLLASVSEAFNNSVLQAQACGLAVVCSDEGGLPENIKDGVTGLLAKRRNAWDMADKLELLLKEPYVRLTMSCAASQRAKHNFDLKKSSLQFIAMYKNLL
jgi:colanic acid/amylovoran biosynthesis glycosyltransferase